MLVVWFPNHIPSLFVGPDLVCASSLENGITFGAENSADNISLSVTTGEPSFSGIDNVADLVPVFMELSSCPKAGVSYKLSQTLIFKRCESNYPLCEYLKNNNYILNVSLYSDTVIHYGKSHFRAWKPVKPITLNMFLSWKCQATLIIGITVLRSLTNEWYQHGGWCDLVKGSDLARTNLRNCSSDLKSQQVTVCSLFTL